MKIGILGAGGRMGRMISKEILTGQYGVEIGAEIDMGGDTDSAFKTCDVMIDFTSREACAGHAALARQYTKPLVVGTTGLSAAEDAALLSASAKTAVLRAANMSVGVTLLLSLVEQAAAKLASEFDIEIFEAHHRLKADAPSGTALALGHAAAKGRRVRLDDVMIQARSGITGARVPGSIGMSVLRGGDIVGEHTVTFAGPGERLELIHKASDRAIFARGALSAALWLENKPAGLYSMKDVLGL
ncbi:MAG: 4-hydroxy-tetrahydrodipicolinate reductase [Pseudomonadota bacterium]